PRDPGALRRRSDRRPRTGEARRGGLLRLMASVDFEHVDKSYSSGSTAVTDCTVHIDDGELMVMVGPSGCGKSTLLRLLAGLETPTRGTIRIDGAVVNDRTPQQRNIAMVFQDYALYPHRT